MQTLVLKPDAQALEQAAALLRAGELVGMPTETVYGLAGNGLDGQAALKIFEAKQRPADNPLIEHIAHMDQIKTLIRGELPPQAQMLAQAFWPGPLTMILPKSDRVPREVSAGLDTVAIRMPSHPVARALMQMLAQAFWPGPLTMILPKSDRVPREVSAGLDTVAIRMPSHPVARALIEQSGLPLAAPSANRSGRPSPTRASHVLEDMEGRIPLILDGGPCEVGLESTVVELSGATVRVLRPGGVTPEMIEQVLGGVWVDESVLKPLQPGQVVRSPGMLSGATVRVLRPGGVTPEMIEQVLGGVWVDESVLKPLQPGQVVRSPGMKYRHYAPRGNLTIVKGAPERVAGRIAQLYDQATARGERAAILCMKQNEARYGARQIHALGQRPGLDSVASDLFDALRLMDEQGVSRIFAEAVDAHGLGLAIMNRMGRAAAFHVLDADKGE